MFSLSTSCVCDGSSVAPGSSGGAGRAPAAFTVLELLVTVAIVLILVALVLPSVERARESARRLQCKNNLYQIGVALHRYHAAVNSLPPGWVLQQPVQSDSPNGWGWLAMLLPGADQQTLYNSINFSRHLADRANHTVRLTVVTCFVCPSERGAKRVRFYRSTGRPARQRVRPARLGQRTGDGWFEVAAASYAGVFGTFDPDGQERATGDGTFLLNSATRVRDIIDGTSHTIVVGERSARRLGTTWTGMHQDEEEAMERVVGFACHPPNHLEADEAEFSSRHPGGAHFLFADGAVRFIDREIDQRLYQALATVAGGEVADRDCF